MIEVLLKTIASGISELVKHTTEVALIKVETTMNEVKTEFRSMLSLGLASTQMMILETILVGFLFVIGFFYLGDGLTQIIDLYSGTPGSGGTILGLAFLLIGFVLLHKSKKRIEAIRQSM